MFFQEFTVLLLIVHDFYVFISKKLLFLKYFFMAEQFYEMFLQL